MQLPWKIVSWTPAFTKVWMTSFEHDPPAANVQRVSVSQKEIIPLTKMRATIALRLQQSKQQIPHFYETADIDVEGRMDATTTMDPPRPWAIIRRAAARQARKLPVRLIARSSSHSASSMSAKGVVR